VTRELTRREEAARKEQSLVFIIRGKVKSAYEPKWPIRPELIPVSAALSD